MFSPSEFSLSLRIDVVIGAPRASFGKAMAHRSAFAGASAQK
jgi:hypothetical protein